MSNGQLYLSSDPEITAASIAGKSLAQRINRLDFAELDQRNELLTQLLGTFGEGSTVVPDIKVDYGFNVHLGRNVFVNFDSVFLDVCPIILGDNCQIGPRAQFLAPLHPVENHELRAAGWEYGAPITVGDNVWFGGGVTVCAGVTIGANTVVGAGSVVTKDLPAGVLAVGSPARVIREL
ncbi:MAG TPA: sugar O-acetyltransferase [Candidatus Corynebacterium gallistercoris]|uniref:Acetyltransferase n=1 Tax=Candidatus Corynebacterium gallistercoris TaxID=2838530 RepID=A0A9D1UQH2_9CORY|nr:sugar O-acetyltransferase [Candidatus Corynebacterium gallistercoris]